MRAADAMPPIGDWAVGSPKSSTGTIVLGGSSIMSRLTSSAWLPKAEVGAYEGSEWAKSSGKCYPKTNSNIMVMESNLVVKESNLVVRDIMSWSGIVSRG